MPTEPIPKESPNWPLNERKPRSKGKARIWVAGHRGSWFHAFCPIISLGIFLVLLVWDVFFWIFFDYHTIASFLAPVFIIGTLISFYFIIGKTLPSVLARSLTPKRYAKSPFTRDDGPKFSIGCLFLWFPDSELLYSAYWIISLMNMIVFVFVTGAIISLFVGFMFDGFYFFYMIGCALGALFMEMTLKGFMKDSGFEGLEWEFFHIKERRSSK